MGPRRMPVLPAAALSVLCVSALAAQQPATPHASPVVTPAPTLPTTALAGTWAFDEKGTFEDQRNWRRPVAGDATAPHAGSPASGGSSMYGTGSPGRQ